MKPHAFRYLAPGTLEEAYGHLVEHGEEACVLAGGQSFVPMMNFRLASPGVLVDINALAPLAGIAAAGDMLRIGALTRHCEVEGSAAVAKATPLIASAMPHVAHLAVRNRGTLGGSLALADPAAELPACMLLLDAVMVVGSRAGTRRVTADGFFQGLYATDLGPVELLLGVEIPVRAAGEIFAFQEFSRRHGDFALAGVVARGRAQNGVVEDIRIVAFGIGDRPVALTNAGALIGSSSGRLPDLQPLKDAITSEVAIEGDARHSGALRAQLTAVLVQRCISELTAQARIN